MNMNKKVRIIFYIRYTLGNILFYRPPTKLGEGKGPFTPSVSDASVILLQIKCNVVVQLCNDATEWVYNPFFKRLH